MSILLADIQPKANEIVISIELILSVLAIIISIVIYFIVKIRLLSKKRK